MVLENHLYYDSENSHCHVHSMFCWCEANPENLVNAPFQFSLPHKDGYRWIQTEGEDKIKLVEPSSAHYTMV